MITMAQMSNQIMVRLTTDFYEEVEAIAEAQGTGVAPALTVITTGP